MAKYSQRLKGIKIKGGAIPSSDRIIDFTRYNSMHRKLHEKGLMV